ncbi:hypothetical protein [Dyadobacter sp. CY356]|uniref:hypothetical protein n=1 Tax=Dyadobacter sp. CY356 TaxID=2906442 RepID=UPI001F286421|nr:hypothetical protein [Dyadobacter sp. CY356]MCF0055093.1 hypothetical protein [Dyadobacter sp. CY356]
MIEKQNTLEWLDFIITIALDSSESEVNTLSGAQYENITQQVQLKKQKYIAYLNNQSLTLASRRKSQHVIKQHYGSLLILLDQTARAASQINPLNTLTASALHITTICVYDLLNFIESSFEEYLDLDDRVPLAYLDQFGKERQLCISRVREELTRRNVDPDLVMILLGSLGADTSNAKIQPTSFRNIFYQREVLRGLEQILSKDQTTDMDHALLELLVYLNFNSRPFINYYTQHLSRRVDSVKPLGEKITQLLLSYKQFNQMHRKQGVKLSPLDSDVQKVISNWFNQEIGYLKEQSRWATTPTESLVPASTEPFKVMVLLSVDQIGLFLRALDALRILKARSMNAVFESIVPFLSTPRKQEISWDSMRSKSYSFEEKDKQTVIKLLESIITWIKEY